MHLTNLLTLSLAALAAAAPIVPSTGPTHTIAVTLHDRSLASIWDSITSLVKPIDAPGNEDKASKRDLDVAVSADVELDHEIKRSTLSDLFSSIASIVQPVDAPGNKDKTSKRDVALGLDAAVVAKVDGGLGAAVVRRSSFKELLTSLNSLITPVDVPGNKDESK